MAIVFPGQGAQAVGMAGEWCDTTPAARRLFDRAAEVLGYDLLAICRSGPVEKLGSTAVSQPAILVTSLAALEVLRSRDGNPLASATVTAGLSLGEYTALVFAGAIEFDDAVRLVDLRGRAMQDCADSRPGAMVAVLGVERAALAELWVRAARLRTVLLHEVAVGAFARGEDAAFVPVVAAAALRELVCEAGFPSQTRGRS